jgi:hypothetical protein
MFIRSFGNSVAVLRFFIRISHSPSVDVASWGSPMEYPTTAMGSTGSRLGIPYDLGESKTDEALPVEGVLRGLPVLCGAISTIKEVIVYSC